MERLNSGDYKIVFGTNLSTLNIGLMKCGKSKMAGGGGNKKRFQYCTDSSGQEILYFRVFQGHSGRNPIDPSRQCVNSEQFLRVHFYHIGCAISLHSITNSGLTAEGKIQAGKDRRYSLRL